MATTISEQAAPVAAQRQGPLGQVPLAGKSVLIIEDEALIAMGFPVVITTGDEADRGQPALKQSGRHSSKAPRRQRPRQYRSAVWSIKRATRRLPLVNYH